MANLNRVPRRFLLGILGSLILTVLLTALLMRPSLTDLGQLALIYALTAAVSAVIGFAAQRWGWSRRLGSLSASLTLGYVLAAGLTLMNVWVAARLMFVSQHDLALAGVLLLFASGISISFGYLLSLDVAEALKRMVSAADRLSQGDFSVRVEASGEDEAARLARAFNGMAARLQAADEEANRLEAARRDFLVWVSHDLRTPLSSLRAMTDALADDVVEDPQTRQRYLAQCQLEIQRMSSLIDDLFELSRLDTGEFEMDIQPCSLADLVSDALGALTERARAKGVKLHGQVDPSVDPIRLAPKEISRVLDNLLDNALRHTPAQGEIFVEATRDGGEVRVSVRDSGEGISPEDLPRIFQRFYRGERSRSRQGHVGAGAGLGLAIARRFVEAHGGRIWAEEAGSGGAVVGFSLPG